MELYRNEISVEDANYRGQIVSLLMQAEQYRPYDMIHDVGIEAEEPFYAVCVMSDQIDYTFYFSDLMQKGLSQEGLGEDVRLIMVTTVTYSVVEDGTDAGTREPNPQYDEYYVIPVAAYDQVMTMLSAKFAA